ncbi:hypothetical protein ACFE04_022780 [Oxalis oulophora]
MKRQRDEVEWNSQSKRLHTGESSRQLPRGKMKKLRKNYASAVAYLKAVEDTFEDKREIYDEFLQLMGLFKNQRIDSSACASRVRQLFKGHPDLILGFSAFLPPEQQITLTVEDQEPPQPKPVDLQEALDLVNKIKARYSVHDPTYKSFLAIMSHYKRQQISIPEVYQKVATLFEDHPDLLVDFTHFLPETIATASTHVVVPGRNLVACDRRSAMPTNGKMVVNKKERTKASDVDRLLNFDRSNPDHDRSMVKADIEKESYREKVKESGEEDIISQMVAFREKVKKKLCNADAYRTFLRTLRLYDEETITKSELRLLVSDLIGRYPELMDGFGEFLACCEENEGFLAAVVSEISLWDHENLPGSAEVEDKHRDPDRERDDVVKNRNHDDLERGIIEKNVRNSIKLVGSHKMLLFPSKDKNLGKPINELDLSSCEKCTRSYRLLPKNYQIPIASGRTEFEAEILNDHWVSTTSGSEDHSFKHMRKNPYEESLFRCEDDRFELDMLLKSVNATIKLVEELVEKIDNHSIKVASIHIEDHIPASNLRCIERLYGDHGLEVIDALKRNAALALPVILTRFKEKQEEWTKCQTEFNKVWAKVYAKNHYKSLDHRSFHFKEQDKNNLSTKALLTDVKDISMKNCNEDEALLSFFSESKRSTIPHLTFEFPDPDLHEDLYQLVKYSCGEICTSNQFDKIMKIWTTFLEPMLRIPYRQNAVEPNDLAADEPMASSQVSESVRQLSVEREEDFEENSNAAYGKTDFEEDVHDKAKGRILTKQNKTKNEKEENNADDCQDIAQNSSEGSENDSEISNISGTDADVEESSQEELRFSDCSLQTVKPLAKLVPPTLHDQKEEDSLIFYGNDSFYVLFRLHHTLYERIRSAKIKSAAADEEWKTIDEKRPKDGYVRFMSELYNLVDGSSDNEKFEDDCRAIFGAESYVLFTLDKLIHRLVKQLHSISVNEMDNELLQLYAYEKSRKGGQFVDLFYHDNARGLIHDENIYRFKCSSTPTRMSIQLMDNAHYKPQESAFPIDPHFAAYLHNDFLSVVPEKDEKPGIYLRRNKRKCAAGNGSNSMEGLKFVNGLECELSCASFKVKYVVGTEDILYRQKRKIFSDENSSDSKQAKVNLSRVEKFKQFLEVHVGTGQVAWN